MYIHPITRQRAVRAKRSGDLVLDAQGPLGTTQEILPVIGGWKDYTGSGGIPTKFQMLYAGIADKIFGTNAWHEGARDKQRGQLGENVETQRLRTKKLYIEDPDKQ